MADTIERVASCISICPDAEVQVRTNVTVLWGPFAFAVSLCGRLAWDTYPQMTLLPHFTIVPRSAEIDPGIYEDLELTPPRK